MKHNRTSRHEKTDSVSSVDKFANQLKTLAPGVADVAIEQAKMTIEQAVLTFEKGKETYLEARKTLVQAKSTMGEVRTSFKGAMGKVRANPEPYFAAIAPGAMGVYVLVEKWRQSQTA